MMVQSAEIQWEVIEAARELTLLLLGSLGGLGLGLAGCLLLGHDESGRYACQSTCRLGGWMGV